MYGRIQAEAKERLSQFASLVKLIAKKRLASYSSVAIRENTITILVSDFTSFLELQADVEIDGAVEFKTDISKFLHFLEEEGDIEFRLGERLELKSGGKKVKLPVEEVHEFNLDYSGLIKIFETHPSIFKVGLDKVINFTNPKDMVFSHVLIRGLDNRVEIVGTDGHRLVIHAIPEKIGEFSMYIPHEAVKVLRKWLDIEMNFIEVEVYSTLARFIGENSTLTIRLGEVNFPDYNAVIPKDWKHSAGVSREDFLNIIKDVKDYLGVVPVILNIERGGIKIEADDPNEGAYENTVEADYEGDNIRVGFNVSYLIDALEAVNDAKIVMFLNDADSVVSIKPDNSEELTEIYVMPMRL